MKNDKPKRSTRKRNQTEFYFEQAVKQLEDEKAPKKRMKLDDYPEEEEEAETAK